MDIATDNATTQRADLTLKSAGQYLRNGSLRHLPQELTGLVRQNPIPALLCGLAVGFFVGHAGASFRRHSHV